MELVSKLLFSLLAILVGIGIILALSAVTSVAGAGVSSSRILQEEQEHAWCYILLNKPKYLGNFDMLACVPKCNHKIGE